MILVIDVGNTNMTLGVYEGQSLKATFRMMTKTCSCCRTAASERLTWKGPLWPAWCRM